MNLSQMFPSRFGWHVDVEGVAFKISLAILSDVVESALVWMKHPSISCDSNVVAEYVA